MLAALLALPLMRGARLARAPILPLTCEEHLDCVAPERCDCVFLTLRLCCEIPGVPVPIPVPVPPPNPFPA